MARDAERAGLDTIDTPRSFIIAKLMCFAMLSTSFAISNYYLLYRRSIGECDFTKWWNNEPEYDSGGGRYVKRCKSPIGESLGVSTGQEV